MLRPTCVIALFTAGVCIAGVSLAQSKNGAVPGAGATVRQGPAATETTPPPGPTDHETLNQSGKEGSADAKRAPTQHDSASTGTQKPINGVQPPGGNGKASSSQ